MPCVRKPCDAIHGVQDFRQELIAQAGRFSIVETDGFVQFGFGDLQEPYLHLFVFFKHLFEGDRLQFSRLVGVQPVFRLLGP